jgi:hypothetical protein
MHMYVADGPQTTRPHGHTETADTGRIYIKGYISYPYVPKSPKRIFPITFWRRIFWGYNILILGVSKFISYILF